MKPKTARLILEAIAQFRVVALAGLCCTCSLAILIPGILWEYSEYQREQGWIEFLAQPLSPAVQDDLCVRQLVPSHVSNCQDTTATIQRSQIQDIVQSNITNTTTFDDADNVFGKYWLDCHPDPDKLRCRYAIDNYYFVIYYDLSDNTAIELGFSGADGDTDVDLSD